MDKKEWEYNEHLTLRITSSFKDQLVNEAQKLDMSVSELIRYCIRQQLNIE